jgi:ABC-2 type transport system ATP-binding protein
MTNIIKVSGLTKSFGKNHVLKGVDVGVAKGSIYALLGSNGSGKTTMVNILSTLMLPDAGHASIGGYNIVKQDKKVRGIISLTGQYAAVDELLTGHENMLMMGRFSHVKPNIVKRRTQALLQQLDLTQAAGRRASTYSGGMRRRLDLAVSLLAQPPVIFLDEPTTGLDPRSRKKIWGIIKDLVADGTTIFLTTQYLEEADQLADKIGVLHNGRIVADGTAEALKRQAGGELVEITLAGQEDFVQAKKCLDDRIVAVKQNRHTLSATTDGTPASLRELLNDLASDNIEPKRVRIIEQTLDDVFMQLTETKKEDA